MKRIFAIISVLALLACCITPAFATSAEFEDSMINYFDYSDADAYYTVYQSSPSISFELPRRQYVRYVDLIIASGQVINGISVTRGSVTQSLTMQSIGNGYYRVYGAIGGGSAAWGDSITFNFDVTSTGASIMVLQFYYTNHAVNYWNDTAGLWVSNAGMSGIQYMPNANSPILADFQSFEYQTDVYGSIYLNNWRKYDYMDIVLKVDFNGFSSLGVQLGKQSIPFSLSFLDSSLGVISYLNSDTFVGSNNVYYEAFLGQSYQWVMIHVDLRGLNRSQTQNPEIFFTGKLRESSDQYMQLDSVAGYVIVENQSQLAFWFNNLKDHLSEIFKPNNETENDINNSIQENESIDQEISDGITDVGEDLGDVDVNTNLTEIGADPSHFISFFTILFNNYYILRIFWIAALMMILGYIFHGQR